MENKISISSKTSDGSKQPKITITSIKRADDEDSKLCRSILSFYIESCRRKEPKTDFGITELANWLVEHHMQFVNEFATSKISKSYRVHSKRTYIQNRINDLISLGCICQIGTVKSQKNTALNTQVYSFTEAGVLLAWLLEARYTKNKTRSEAINTVFEITSLLAQFVNSYATNFISIFLRRCVESKISDLLDNKNLEYFIFFHESFARPKFRPIELFLILLEIMGGRIEVQKLFVETINSLDIKIQRIIMHELKLHIESEYGTRYRTEEWETIRHDNIHICDKVVLSVYCEACKSAYPFIMHVFEFVELYSLTPSVLNLKGPKLDCTKCGKSNTVYIGLGPRVISPSITEAMKKVNTIFVNPR
jgi:hypothetical protein